MSVEAFGASRWDECCVAVKGLEANMDMNCNLIDERVNMWFLTVFSV